MQHTLSSDKLTVIINSAGAEICSITDQTGLQYIWQADKTIWPRHAPVLFPIVGRLKENTYFFNDRSYNLNQHGFARDFEFNLIEKTPSYCSLELRANERTIETYPFQFTLNISYQLHDNRLVCSYKIVNSSKEVLFFSIGAHPGFNCPLEDDERFEDYYLKFDSLSEISCTELENGLRTNSRRTLRLKNSCLFLEKKLFEKDALVLESEQVNRVTLRSNTSSRAVTIECAEWPYFGIWTKKNDERFICLEPWCGVADHVDTSKELSEKEGIHRLGGGEEFNREFSIIIS